MTITVRNATLADAGICGRIIYEAFKTVADRHGFAPDFPSAAPAMEFAKVLTSHPSIFGIVAEVGGRVVGSNFLWERDSIRGVGPLTVEPGDQGHGIGRRLMAAVLTRARSAAGVRLVQDAFNTSSIALYASLGFVVREPLLLLQGVPKDQPVADAAVRPLTEADVGICDTIANRVHGNERGGELRDALRFLKPLVVERHGRVRGYLTMPSFWPANHAVAETDEDMQALILGAAALGREPLSMILPTRQSELFRWCLSEGFQVLKPLTLMTIGAYQEPRGAYFPSVIY
ncbi:MAG TPA: GNAT family N-acetyltransferase [Xanthobacteraceae bacterium]|nr:GNAT family N-acetyltransferase [Xanthobacteraceae bacterium]